MIGKYEGATTKTQLIAALEQAKTGSADKGAVTMASSPMVLEDSGQGLAALAQAAAANKYLFAFFWSADDDQTAAMRKVFENTTAKVADRAVTVSVRVGDPAESGIIRKYDLELPLPTPPVLAIAPNGAVTGGFPTEFEEQELSGAFATPGTEKCLKALQDGKLVFVCVQNASTKSNQEALRGVQDFKADARYAGATEILVLDPRDPAEASFLGTLQIDPRIATAVTAFLKPPGSVIGAYQGATTKEQLTAALQQANSSAEPDGGPPK